MRSILDRPLTGAAPVLLEEQVLVNPGDVLLEPVVPLPAQPARVLRVPQAQITSELPELLAVCDRIVVLCEGRMTAELPRSSATEESIMHAATRFLDRAARAS